MSHKLYSAKRDWGRGRGGAGGGGGEEVGKEGEWGGGEEGKNVILGVCM